MFGCKQIPWWENHRKSAIHTHTWQPIGFRYWPTWLTRNKFSKFVTVCVAMYFQSSRIPGEDLSRIYQKLPDLTPDALRCGVPLLWSAMSCWASDFKLFVTLLAKRIACAKLHYFHQMKNTYNANSQSRRTRENCSGIALATNLSLSTSLSLALSLCSLGLSRSLLFHFGLYLSLSVAQTVPLSLSLSLSLSLCSLALSHSFISVSISLYL